MNFAKVFKIVSACIAVVAAAAAVAYVIGHFLFKKDEDFCTYIECDNPKTTA